MVFVVRRYSTGYNYIFHIARLPDMKGIKVHINRDDGEVGQWIDDLRDDGTDYFEGGYWPRLTISTVDFDSFYEKLSKMNQGERPNINSFPTLKELVEEDYNTYEKKAEEVLRTKIG